MEEQPFQDAARRRFKLVFPKTFFSQAFLLPYDSSARGFKVANCYHFIANIVIEVTSCLPENSIMCATTQAAWDEFGAEVSKRGYAVGGRELLSLFQNMIVVIPTDKWGPLGDTESVVALADRLYATSSLDPLIVAHPDGVQNYRHAAARYYGKTPESFNPLDIPFKIYDPIETKAHLQAIFPREAEDVLRKTQPPYNVF